MLGSPGKRANYDHAELCRLLDPHSIAVVGASPRDGAFGERVVANLAEFAGELWCVNPLYPDVLGRRCFPTLSDLPSTPDCVVVALAAPRVEAVVAEAVALGVGGIIVFASGFAETGRPEQIALQERIAALVAPSRTRLVGPNCIGVVNHVSRARMSFTQVGSPTELRRPAIGIVSQSGALGNALAQSARRGVSISHVLTAGNSSDVDIADMVNFLADEPTCDTIVCLFEGITEPARLVDAAEKAWTTNKPVIVYKMATGSVGAAAAASHTGVIAGAKEVYAAAFDHAGMIVVHSIDDLIDTASFFSKAPIRPVADGVAVLSVSGGAGIVVADTAEEQGVSLTVFSPETEAALAAIIPDFGSPRNPCDVTAEILSKPDMLAACADAILSEPDVGVLIHPHPFAREGATDRMIVLAQAAHRHRKMFCALWLSEWLEGPGAVEIEERADVALFRSSRNCLATIRAWVEQGRRRASPPLAARRQTSHEARARVAAQLAAIDATVIGEARAKLLLEAYGVPVVAERTAHTLTETHAAAGAIGYPVAVKIDSPDIAHKTGAGLVLLNIADDAALAEAVATIHKRAAALSPPPRVDGVVVQQMIPSGLELLVGGRRDPQFGPVVVFGFGGVLVELLNDVVTALAPISAAQAVALLSRLKGYRLLTGYRGSTPVDLEELGTIIAGISEFLADHAGVIELDVNPLIATSAGLVAVDALIVRDAATASSALDIAA